MEVSTSSRESGSNSSLIYALERTIAYLNRLELNYTHQLKSSQNNLLLTSVKTLNHDISEIKDKVIRSIELNEQLKKVIANMPNLLGYVSEDKADLLIPEVRALHLDLLNRYIEKLKTSQL